MVKNQAAREVQFDNDMQGLRYVRPRSQQVLPYRGIRISDVQDFSEHSRTGGGEEQHNELEKRVLVQINDKARTLKADAYEITNRTFESDEEHWDVVENDEANNPAYYATYSALFSAIFYRKS